MPWRKFLTTEYVVMDKTTQKDEEFGGIITVWKEGAPFVGHMVKRNDSTVLIAEQEGAKAIYTLVTDKKVVLERGMMIRRLEDKADFAIKSDPRDMQAPETSRLQFSQVIAERVVL